MRNQILAWIGDEGSYVENQARFFAESTFAWTSSSELQKVQLTDGISQILSELERQDVIIAASPYQLTSLGNRMRLAGLAPESCLRISRALEQFTTERVVEMFSNCVEISPEMAPIICRLVFEAEEVIESSMWFRRLGLKPEQQPAALRSLMSGERRWPEGNDIFEADIQILVAWILGQSYRDLGDIPPFMGPRSAFSSKNSAEKASDAAEQIGRLAYSAGWAWGAVRALLGDEGDSIPGWIRRAIELGVPNETATELIRILEISREAAITLSVQLSPRWSDAEPELLELNPSDPRVSGLREGDLMILFPYIYSSEEQ